MTTLLLDFDGVLNPDKVEYKFKRKDKLYIAARGLSYDAHYDVRVLNALGRLIRSRNIKLKWCTSWCDEYVQLNEVLARYGFPPGEPAFCIAEGNPYLVCDMKLQAYIKECANSDFVIWIDDDSIPDNLTRYANSTLIKPDPTSGLTLAQIHNLDFALATRENT